MKGCQFDGRFGFVLWFGVRCCSVTRSLVWNVFPRLSKDRGAVLVCASASQVPLGGDLFDLVLCNDVLQHVPDDRGVLDEASRVLASGGILCLRTNCRFLIPSQPGCLRLYTRRRLHDLLSAAGFEPLVVSRANALGSVIGAAQHYLSARKTAEVGGLKIAPREAAGPGAADRLMRATLRAEAHLMGRADWLIPFGHSLVAVARKPAAA